MVRDQGERSCGKQYGEPREQGHWCLGGHRRLRGSNTGSLLAQCSHAQVLASEKKEEQQAELPWKGVGSLGAGVWEFKGLGQRTAM